MSDACCSPDRDPSAPQEPTPAAAPSGDAPTHETTGTMVTLPRRHVRHGQRRPVGLPGGRRGPGAPGDALPVRHRPLARDQRGVPFVRGGHRSRHRERALRLVVRVRRAAPRRLPRHAWRRAGPVVATGLRRRLAASRRAARRHRRPARPPCRPRVVERRHGVRRLGGQAAADGGGVGARGAGRARGSRLPVGGRPRTGRRAPHERVAGRPSPPPTRSTTGSSGRRRWDRSRRTATGWSTPPATCGSGSPTASPPSIPPVPSSTRPVPRRATAGCSEGARTCAMPPTAAATGWPAA